jgi:two-component system cell cycle response regulator
MTVSRQTSINSIKVLLIEDNPGDARLIQETLFDTVNVEFDVQWVDMLDKGIELISKTPFDVVLLDLSFPDSQGIETIIVVREQARVVPIVVLTGLDDEEMAIQAVQHGAQDYLIKGEVNSSVIMRSMRYAIERHRLQGELYKMSIVDELTGLYNRRGFFTLAEHLMNTGDKGKKGYFLIVSDLDGMKQINDSFGHHMGDLALIDTTIILKEIFSNSNIIARMGGDEFVVIFPQDPAAKHLSWESLEQEIITRMQQKLNSFNQSSGRCYHLSISLGLSYYNPDFPVTLDELFIQADHRMYSYKKEKNRLK